MLLVSNAGNLHGRYCASQRVYIDAAIQKLICVPRIAREIPAIGDGICRHGMIEISYLKALSISLSL